MAAEIRQIPRTETQVTIFRGVKDGKTQFLTLDSDLATKRAKKIGCCLVQRIILSDEQIYDFVK